MLRGGLLVGAALLAGGCGDGGERTERAALLARVEALEQQVLRLQAAGGGERVEFVEAKAIRLTDDQGNVRVELGVELGMCGKIMYPSGGCDGETPFT